MGGSPEGSRWSDFDESLDYDIQVAVTSKERGGFSLVKPFSFKMCDQQWQVVDPHPEKESVCV